MAQFSFFSQDMPPKMTVNIRKNIPHRRHWIENGFLTVQSTKEESLEMFSQNAVQWRVYLLAYVDCQFYINDNFIANFILM